jgi:hypothetical protein
MMFPLVMFQHPKSNAYWGCDFPRQSDAVNEAYLFRRNVTGRHANVIARFHPLLKKARASGPFSMLS